MAEGQSGQGHFRESPSSPVPDFDEDEQSLADYTILIEALDYPRSGDMNEFFAQDRAATSVKRFLYQAWSEEDPNLRKQQIKRNVKLLSECSQFLPFLRRILRSETIYVTLTQKGLWILGVIIAHGERSFVNQLEDYHLGNLLMHYMRSPHKAVSEQAVSTAAQVALAPSLRYQLLPCASVIFPTLVHILQQLKENPGSDPNLLRNVGELVSGMLIVPEEIHQKLQHAVASLQRNAEGEEERMEAFREYVDSHPELKKHMANLRMVQMAIPVIKLLLESGDKQIQCVMLHCVGVILKVFHNVQTLIEGKIGEKLAEALSHPDPAVMVYAVVALGQLSLKMDNLITFINAVEETNWLKKYWKVIPFLDSGVLPSDDIKKSIVTFLCGMIQILGKSSLGPPTLLNIKTVLNSGLHFAVGHLMEADVLKEIRVVAIALMRIMLSMTSPDPRRTFLDCGPLTAICLVNIIKRKGESKNDPLMEMRPSTARILGYLVENCEKRRDEVIALGGLGILFNLLKEYSRDLDFRPVQYILFAISKLLQQRPVLPLEVVKDVPAGFQGFWKLRPNDMDDITESFVIPALCLCQVAKCGEQGIDAIFQQEELVTRVMRQLIGRSEVVQETAMSVVLELCKGTKMHRMRIVNEWKLLNKFPGLMKCIAVSTRKQVMECLYAFLYEGILDHKQRHFVRVEMWPLVKEEIKREISDTHLISVFVHNELTKLFGGCEYGKENMWGGWNY